MIQFYIDPYEPLPDNTTKEEYQHTARKILVRTIALFFVQLILLALCSLFTSCTTHREVTSSVEHHKMETLIGIMDSLSRVKTSVQHDSTWRQEILRQFQSIRERSDTSHTMVVDSAGHIIKEKLVINNTRETTSETDRQEREVMMRRLEVMDSTLQVMQQSLQQSDSMLREQQQVKIQEVAKPLPWWQQIQLLLGRFLLVAIALFAAWWLYKEKVNRS